LNLKYNIIIEPEAENDLLNIFSYIKENDSEVKARNFIKKLQKSINSLSFMPQRYRNSHYIEDGRTKDLIYHGYTICYHILNESVHIVAIFRQR
jgi:plasmid stabilization system protein ParE